MNVGSPATLLIQATIVSAESQTNTATITHADQFDSNPGNNTATATQTPQQADLALTKTVNDTTPNVGDTITYTITLSNNGPDPATSTQVTDPLASGLTFVSDTPSQGTYDSGTGLWSVGTVNVGSPATLLIQATVTSPKAQTNTATITKSDQFDAVTTNNSSSVVETPQLSDLALTKTVNDTTPNVGDTITYTVQLSNNGPDGATNVQVADALPSGVLFVSARSSQGTYDPGTGLWNVGTVTTSFAQTLVIQATVVSPEPQTNTATIAHADQFDPMSTNNNASATQTPQRADLALAKGVSDPTPNVGDTITYTVTLSNNGPDVATNVQVTDRLPAGVSFVSAVPSQGTYNSVAGLWTVNTVTTSAPLTLVLTGTVVDASKVINTATITHADQFDPDLSNNTAIAPETPRRADLAVAKSADDPTPNVGDTVTYIVTLSNDGPDDATTVRVRDRLPAGVSFVSATPSQGAYDSTTGLWTVGTVTMSAPLTLVLKGVVVSPIQQINTARIVHSDQFDSNTGNNKATATLTPQQADLVLSKTVNNPTPNVGEIITYTLTLTNNGPNTATNVQTVDRLPAGLSFVSATPSQGTYDPASGVWALGTVTTASPQTLMIQARVVIAGRRPTSRRSPTPISTTQSPTSNTDGVVVISPSPEVIPGAPPTITSLQRFGLHAQPTEFVLAFSSALDSARAQDPLNYTLRPIGPHGNVGGTDSDRVRGLQPAC